MSSNANRTIEEEITHDTLMRWHREQLREEASTRRRLNRGLRHEKHYDWSP